MQPSSSAAQTKSDGFTLMEIAMAVALIGIVVTSVLSLVTMSTQQMNQADLKTKQARIAQGLISEVLLNEWDSIDEYHDTLHFFDSEGYKITGSKEDADRNEENYGYLALIELSDQPAGLPETSTVPFQKNGGKVDPVGRVITVYITDGGMWDYDFEEMHRHETFSSWVTKMDLK